MPELIKVKTEDHIAVVTLDNPPLNLLGSQILNELLEGLKRLSADKQVRVIVLTGEGERAFCGGGDRRTHPAATAPQLEEGFIFGRTVYDSVRECEVPTIAAVNGPAIGGGLALVASCDIVIAAERAVFALPEVNIGMWPQFRYLARLVPELKMRRMVLSGQKITARELYRFGSIEQVVNNEELMPAAMQIAREIAEKNNHIVRLFKKAINSAENMDVKSSLQKELGYIHMLVQLHDATEIRKSFKGKPY